MKSNHWGISLNIPRYFSVFFDISGLIITVFLNSIVFLISDEREYFDRCEVDSFASFLCSQLAG